MISSSRKLTVISGIVAAVIATVGVALTLTAPAVSKDGVDSTSTGGPQGYGDWSELLTSSGRPILLGFNFCRRTLKKHARGHSCSSLKKCMLIRAGGPI